MGTVEPVFANLRHNKRLNRFTLRGRAKVGTQWQLYCLGHNIGKLATAGDGHRKGQGGRMQPVIHMWDGQMARDRLKTGDADQEIEINPIAQAGVSLAAESLFAWARNGVNAQLG